MADRISNTAQSGITRFFNVSSRKVPPYERLNFALDDEKPVRGLVYHYFKPQRLSRMKEDLTDLLQTSTGKPLIFAEKRSTVTEIGGMLSGIPSVGYRHGDVGQEQRQKVLDDFEAGTLKTLVTTRTMADGVNVEGVTQVIHYQLPSWNLYGDVLDEYIQRTDRVEHTLQPARSFAFYDDCHHILLGRLSLYLVEIGQQSSAQEVMAKFNQRHAFGPKLKSEPLGDNEQSLATPQEQSSARSTAFPCKY